MTQCNRETLRKHFGEGCRPNADHFGELIESTLNIVEDGIWKTPAEGLRVRALTGHSALVSFYRPQSVDDADWSMSFGGEDRQLLLRSGKADADNTLAPLLSLQPGPRIEGDAREGRDGRHRADSGGRIGVHTATPRPQTRLDVDGVIGASGRMGAEPLTDQPLLANGRWQALLSGLRGCHAFEVTAGAGRREEAHQFALVHAVAMNAFNPSRWDDLFNRKKSIRHQHAYYSRRCERIQLRWEGEPAGEYRLLIRTRCDFAAKHRQTLKKGEVLDPAREVRIRAFVTRLWFDDLTDPKAQP